MRMLFSSLLLAVLLLPAAPSSHVLAQTSFSPCALALGPSDLPRELRPESNGTTDASICDRHFRSDEPGSGGVSSVRSLVIVSSSNGQAAADFAEYRALLVQAGWEQGPGQPVGEQSSIFSGSDPEDGIFTVQLLALRGNVVFVTEVTGPAVAQNPGIVLNLSKMIDGRASAELASRSADPLLRPSMWVPVLAPTIVRDSLLADSPIGPNVQLGGFSGLISLNREGTRFVTVTDRGPYGELEVARKKVLGLPLPAYTPSIVKLELQGTQLKAVESIGLRLAPGYFNARTGTPFATGLPNSDSDPAVFDQTGKTSWGTDPYGLDPEGIALDPRDGSYWIVEEYGPSILNVVPDGTVRQRLVPWGSSLDAPGQNVQPILPPELAMRRPDRGFEGVAVSPDGTRLFALMQAPLANPDRKTGESSRNIRLITLDLTASQPVVNGMYLYLMEPFDAVGATRQDDLKAADLIALSNSSLLVVERDNTEGGSFKMVYRVELVQATNILGIDLGGQSFESQDEGWLAYLNVRPVSKSPFLNMVELGQAQNFEGLALVDQSTVAVVSDSGFGFGGFDRAGRPMTSGIRTRLSVVRLPGTLN